MTALIETEQISEKSRIMFVNDGSKDTTWSLIEQLHEQNPLFQGVCLSRNRGHQNALLAGLMTAKEHCDMAISLDADLQDDIDAIDGMVAKYYEGCDIVYGVRNSRETDTFFKKFTAEGYYHLMNFLGADIVFNHADYRLMSKRALEGLADFPEVNMFLRGVVPMIGYKSDKVFYARKERFAGESKYPLKKMLAFAWEGITSLTTKPIRMITTIGAVVLFVSIIMMIVGLVKKITGHYVNTTLMSVWLLGGLQLLSTGIIGEYIGKIYLESKARPKFIISRYLGDDEQNDN